MQNFDFISVAMRMHFFAGNPPALPRVDPEIRIYTVDLMSAIDQFKCNDIIFSFVLYIHYV